MTRGLVPGQFVPGANILPAQVAEPGPNVYAGDSELPSPDSPAYGEYRYNDLLYGGN